MITSSRAFRASSGVISGSGFAMAKMIGSGGHRLDHFGRQRALGRQAEKNVRAGHRLFERAQLGVDRVSRLPLVHALVASAIDDPFGVAEDDVRRFEADRFDQVEASDAGGACAIAYEARRFDVAPGEMNRVDHSGGRDDRGAVLIVVKYRDVHHLAQALFDVEALGRLDILEIDPSERGARDISPHR